jgi:hypothetical protein
LIKRIALGFAVAAFAAPVAQAKLDEGGQVQSNGYQSFVTDFPSMQTSVAVDYGMPRALPSDYALASGDQIEAVRAEPRGTSSDKIEFVRTKPRSIGEPQVVAAGFNWDDAAVGAGLVLGLVLLGGGAVVATRHLGKAQTA